MMNSSSSISRRASLKQMGMAAAGAGLGLGFASAAETVPAASGKKLKVALVNGSPHEHGCTYTALKEVAGALEGCGAERSGKIPFGGRGGNGNFLDRQSSGSRVHRLRRMPENGQVLPE